MYNKTKIERPEVDVYVHKNLPLRFAARDTPNLHPLPLFQ